VAAAGAWGLGGRVALLIAALVTTPFTIRLLGSSRYGLWALLLTSLTWAALANLGMGTASTKFGAEHYARGDDLGEVAVVWTALSLTAITTSCAAVVVAVEAPAILAHLLHVRGDLLGPGELALRIVCALFVVQAVAGTVNTPQVVRLRWRQYTIITTAAGLIAAIGTPVALVLLSGGVVTAASVGLGAAALGALGTLLLSVRVQPALRRPRVSKVVLRQLVGYGSALTVSSLAIAPLSTAERFFLADNHSTVVVAYYAVAATLATTLNVLPGQLVGPLLPALTRLEAQGRLGEHRDLYRKSLSGLFLVLTPAAILLAFLAHPFLSLWAGTEYGLHSTGPLLVLVGGVWVNCLAWVPYTYLLSSGHTKILAYVNVAEILPFIAAAWVLTAKFGAIGAALVVSAMSAVDAVVFFVVVRHVAQLPFSPLSERRTRSVAVPVALGCAAMLAATVGHGLAIRLGWAALLSGVYAAAVWRLVLTPTERGGLLSLAAEVVGPGPWSRRSGRAT
jgi:O-antigen/teichoic acid export membrane protein